MKLRLLHKFSFACSTTGGGRKPDLGVVLRIGGRADDDDEDDDEENGKRILILIN